MRCTAFRQTLRSKKVIERYDSPGTLGGHGKTEYLREANKRLAVMVSVAPEIEIRDAVVRLARNTPGALITRARALSSPGY